MHHTLGTKVEFSSPLEATFLEESVFCSKVAYIVLLVNSSAQMT